LRQRVFVQCTLEEFVDRWAQHIPERYQHAVRCFGLFAPRPLRQTSAAVFLILGQEQRQRPKPRRWADSLKRDFGHDPLLDGEGKRMKWVRRIAPKAAGNRPTDYQRLWSPPGISGTPNSESSWLQHKDKPWQETSKENAQ